MAAPSVGFWQQRGAFDLHELVQSWWRHRVSFIISVVITFGALTLYYFTFFGEKSIPLFAFLERLEFNSLDTRFRYRPPGATPPDPRIVIVEIDQQSQEALGKWPFSRTHFAAMLDVLHDDGAKVVAFDITFDKPDRTADPVRALWARLEQRRKSGAASTATAGGKTRRKPFRAFSTNGPMTALHVLTGSAARIICLTNYPPAGTASLL